MILSWRNLLDLVWILNLIGLYPTNVNCCTTVLPSRFWTWTTHLKVIHACKNSTLLISQYPMLLSGEDHCQTVVPLLTQNWSKNIWTVFAYFSYQIPVCRWLYLLCTFQFIRALTKKISKFKNFPESAENRELNCFNSRGALGMTKKKWGQFYEAGGVGRPNSTPSHVQ